MPLYSYLCNNENCRHAFEIVHDYHKKALKRCPKCKKHKLERVPQIPYVAIRGEPTTITHLADRNTEAMGHYEHQEKVLAKEKPPKETPWWRSGPVDTKLASLTPKQKKKFIETGEKP